MIGHQKINDFFLKKNWINKMSLFLAIEPEDGSENYPQRHDAPLFVGNEEKTLETIKPTLKNHIKNRKKILLCKVLTI